MAVGTGIGLALSLLLGTLVARMLFQISGADPLVFSAAVILLGAVSLPACNLPARRPPRGAHRPDGGFAGTSEKARFTAETQRRSVLETASGTRRWVRLSGRRAEGAEVVSTFGVEEGRLAGELIARILAKSREDGAPLHPLASVFSASLCLCGEPALCWSLMDRLFVYGTLRSVFQNEFARLLAEGESLLGGARIRGRLYDIGRYPGLVLSSAAEESVAGEVYRLRDAERTLAILDRYEGADFTRVTGDVLLDIGEQAPAWVYVYNRPVDEKRRILSGDYLDRLDRG